MTAARDGLLDYLRAATGASLPEPPVSSLRDPDPYLRWARSGLAMLSGPEDALPVLPQRDVIARCDEMRRAVETLAAASGAPIAVDPRVFTERSALSGHARRGQRSAGGACRLIAARDGWIAVNLARPQDIDGARAWVGCGDKDDLWSAIADAAARRDGSDLAASAHILDLPVAAVGSHQPGDPVRLARIAADRAPKQPTGVLVLDFSALWAGPLCGHTFTAMGARVIKIESTSRPDGARFGPAAFFDLLHAGQESIVLDFAAPGTPALLKALIAKADVVIEASRPRAFAQLGLNPHALGAGHPGLTWISITAYGRESASSNRVGFGDDVAAAAGLVADDALGRPCFLGDAFADPITGVMAAAAALAALHAGGGLLVDASMVGAAGFVAAAPLIGEPSATWTTDDQGGLAIEVGGRRHRVAPPQARPTASRAPLMGADTARILAEFT